MKINVTNYSALQAFQALMLFFIAFIFSYTLLQSAYAQNVYGNEWIQSGNSYRKFEIAKRSIYRISDSELNVMGFSGIQGSQFALFRDGKEVPIYTSTNGVFTTNDYILFYGSPANGSVNRAVYQNPSDQPDTLVNLFCDSAAYYLTYDNGSHQRFSMISSVIPSPAPTAAAYCSVTSFPTDNQKKRLYRGKSYDNIDEYFYSSQFDKAEGWGYYQNSTGATLHFPSQGKYTGAAPAPTLSFVVSSATNQINAVHQFSVRKSWNGTHFFDTSYSGYNYIRKTISVPLSFIKTNTTNFSFRDNRRFALYAAGLRYSRNFNFSGLFAHQAYFELPSGERYLKITNFHSGTAAPLLFDLTNHKIYPGVLDAGSLEFYLDNDVGNKRLFLTNDSVITNIADFQSVQFRDYSLAANQGNYIILTHKDLINANPDYIAQYASYRSSPDGGGYQPVVVDVTELYNQFAYGYKGDPLAVRRFIRYAAAHWSIPPQFLFIIGKGIGYQYYTKYRGQRNTYTFPIVPTWGDPGSDNLLSATNYADIPTLATGRLSVYTNQEIGDYLQKIKDYELALKPAVSPSVSTELWKKKALCLAGASDLSLQAQLLSSLNACASYYTDTLIGGLVETIAKSSTAPTQDVNDPGIDSLINNGVNIITFYGHASSVGFDYNLNDPDFYHASPRFPIFLAFGCDVAQIFNLTNDKTISEHYLRSQDGGSVVMVAEDNLGYTGSLNQYMKSLYKTFSQTDYGLSFGEQYQKNIEHLLTVNSGDYMKIHTQCLLYQGDPALHIYQPEKPDYEVEHTGLTANPVNISTATDSFELNVIVYNLGKAIRDTVTVTVAHTHSGSNQITFADTLHLFHLFNADTLKFKIPVDPIRDVGLNNYTVRVAPDNEIDEISEQNNQAVIQLFIYANSVVPLYPQKFAIVHQQGITLKASTLNAFAPTRKYKFEIDTTARFNSPLLQQKEIIKSGGVLAWKPAITLRDSTVYYWRTAPDSLVNGSLNWRSSSFIYLTHGSDGWNQSHYFQYLNDEMNALDLSQTSRKFVFTPAHNTLIFQNKVIYDPNNYPLINQVLNDIVIQNWACYFKGSVEIMVIDSASGMPWTNTVQGSYGSIGPCSSSHTHNWYSFQFPTTTFAGRDSAIKMLQRIPDGDYVGIYNILYNPLWNGYTIDDWKADTAVLGSGNSLYHAIKNLGFTDIDQFTSKKSFIFFRKKGDDNYPVYQNVAADSTSTINVTANYLSYPESGKLKSAVIGPALAWQALKWKMDNAGSNPDSSYSFVQIFGINNQGQQTALYQGFAKDTSLAFINAQTYPKIRLVWNSVDTENRTSDNLKYWRVLFQPVPEAALDANQGLYFKDSLSAGEKGELKLTIANLTPYPMDSMLVKYKIVDANNVAHPLIEKRYRKLPAEDTLTAYLNFDATQYPGKNFLYIEANPHGDQPEQYHPNNVGYLSFFMKEDKVNPLLDVTFDGVHILNQDIVSAKPLIKILLKDNSAYQPLKDTSLIKVQLVYPGTSNPVDIPFDGKTCIFFPAGSGGKNNVAHVAYRPDLKKDGVYKLIVTGKDEAGNAAGNTDKYEVAFKVENKPSITNVLNYPNPFSTATQFLFTITGSEIPAQFKIQILTVTGKVVREITKAELGPLHIGRNITQYHWDGRDENGQLLGNGVYLYRVITSLHGRKIAHKYDATIDGFFKNGYGKLYIMR